MIAWTMRRATHLAEVMYFVLTAVLRENWTSQNIRLHLRLFINSRHEDTPLVFVTFTMALCIAWRLVSLLAADLKLKQSPNFSLASKNASA